MNEAENLSPSQFTPGRGEDSQRLEPLPFPSKIGRYDVVRQLGEGGFGAVLLAHDEDLKRTVAIKIPRPERVEKRENADDFLAEARVLASLDHPHIVPVYDVGRTDTGVCYVVSKLIEGSDLKTRMNQARLSYRETAGLIAAIAQALHHAHVRGLVHRDVKPANILIDGSGKPFLADFGLALKDDDFDKAAATAGTPAYMSPEQACGEGHRVDGRSDVFSLGVVLYELLTGTRPFTAAASKSEEALAELFCLIAAALARPPRQIDETIPAELERICTKAMAKRAEDRYATAQDMADDLLAFLQAAAGADWAAAPAREGRAVPASTWEATPVAVTARQPLGEPAASRIVPKGLRSFDGHDADFFLELLAGPRDRHGLPESIRFWKQKIEEPDPGKTFPVGLIYGPSGCGKSSLVKAGLLPRLDRRVRAIYIESTAEQTEARLLASLRKACPELPRASGLVDSLAQLRRGRIRLPGEKVLLVLDQFEQWLHFQRTGRAPSWSPPFASATASTSRPW